MDMPLTLALAFSAFGKQSIKPTLFLSTVSLALRDIPARWWVGRGDSNCIHLYSIFSPLIPAFFLATIKERRKVLRSGLLQEALVRGKTQHRALRSRSKLAGNVLHPGSAPGGFFSLLNGASISQPGLRNTDEVVS